MKKLLILVTMALALAGCGGNIDTTQIEAANNLCEHNGGIKRLKIWFEYTIECNNNAEFGHFVWSSEKNKLNQQLN